MSNEKRVLIVDDEPDAVDITEAMLSEIESITTLSANDGESGLVNAVTLQKTVSKLLGL